MKSETIYNHGDMIIRLAALSQGNPGAATVLVQLAKQGKLETIDKLERAGVQGSGFWILYKDICREDINILVDIVSDKSEEELLKLSKDKYDG